MNTIDIIVSGILLWGLVMGFRRGLFVEITSLLGLVLGVYGAIHFSFYLSNIIKNKVDWDPSMIQIVAFAGTFLIIVAGLVFLGKLLTKIAETMMLGFFNKILGAVFGMLKYGLILSVVFILFGAFNKTLKFIDPKKVNESALYEPIKNFAPAIFPDLITVVDKTNKK